MLNVIREYLVSLGYKVDMPSFGKAKGTMREMENVVGSFSNSSVVKFAAAGAAVTAFVGTATAALYQFTVGVANADLQNEIFARRMWMNKDAAVSYKNSLDALGVSLQDLYLSPELMQKFGALRQQASDMELPGGFNGAMKGVRDITFEFQRFKLEASYAVYWVGYYLTKYLAGPLGDTRGWLKSINDTITEKMPHWTKNVAQVLSWFAKLGKAAYLAGKGIKDIWDGLGTSTKEVIGITAGFFALLRMGPVGWMIAGLTTLLLLLDDYYTYSQGGKSAFPEMWKWVDELKESMEDDGTIREFKQSLDALSVSLKDVATDFGQLINLLTGSADKKKIIIDFIDGLTNSLNGLAGSLKAVSGAWKEVHGAITGNKEEQAQGEEKVSKGMGGLLGSVLNKALGAWSIFQGKDPVNLPPGISDILGEGLFKRMGRNFLWPTVIQNPGQQNNSDNKKVSTVISPTYHIYSTSDPQSVASAIDRNNTNILMRVQQGVLV